MGLSIPGYTPATHSTLSREAVCRNSDTMPQEVKNIKEFILKARRKDARSVTVKKVGKVTKFKVRCSKYLYTLALPDQNKASKLRQSLPPTLTINDVEKKWPRTDA